MPDPDFSLTACVVSKCPHRGLRWHPKATIHKRCGGVCGSLTIDERLGEVFIWHTKEWGRSPRLQRGGRVLRMSLQ
jgi:hypothetical protein